MTAAAWRSIGALLLVGLPALTVAQNPAQVLVGSVKDSTTGQPIAGAVVVLRGARGVQIARTITNDRGEYRLSDAGTGRRIEVLRIGFRPRDLPLPISPWAAPLHLTMTAVPTLLEPVQVTSNPRCERGPGAAAAWALLDQARAALLATIAAREANPATLKVLAFERTLDGNSDRIDRQTVRADSAAGAMISFGASRNAATLVERGFVADSSDWRTYYGPDAEVILADEFSRGYCVSIEKATGNLSRNLVGLGFAPANRKRGRVDITGTLWIDSVSRTLERIEFRYAGLPGVVEGFNPGGAVFFRQMENGVVLIDRWSLRIVGSADTVVRDDMGMRVGRGFQVREVGGELARATWPDGREWKARLGSADISVADPAGGIASGLVVKLDGTDYRATADANGHARFGDLVPGPYSIVEHDSTLALLGLIVPAAAPSRFIAVRDSTVDLRFTAPSAEDFIGESCRSEGGGRDERSAWVVGRTMSASGQPLGGVRWTVSRSVGSTWKLVADGGVTSRSGLFYLCRGLAVGETVRIEARGRDSLQQTAIRRLNGGITAVPVRLVSSLASGAVAGAERSTARGVLTGVVRDSASGAGVADARVWLLGTSFQAVTDSSGRFVMRGVPRGDYTLDVRTWTLDSLGVTSQSSFTFMDSAALHVRVPTSAMITAAMCPGSLQVGAESAPSRGVVVGLVRSSGETELRTKARVVAEWDAAPAAPGRAEARTDVRGRFRFCGVPVDAVIRLRAIGDAAVSRQIELRVAPSARFARAELLLDQPLDIVRSRAASDSGANASVALADRAGVRAVRRELVGAVRDVRGLPIADATVTVHSELTRTDASGAFQLWTADLDTATIQVRRLGYTPVDALIKAHARQWDTVVVEMARGVQLSTVNINEAANRRATALRDFDQRRATGLGQFITRQDIEAKATNRLSELLRTMRGVRVVRVRNGVNGIRFAVHAGGRAGCDPAVWLDGQRAPGLEVDDLLPADIEAIELYETLGTTPSEFTTGVTSTCGTIVIWSRVPPPPKP